MYNWIPVQGVLRSKSLLIQTMGFQMWVGEGGNLCGVGQRLEQIGMGTRL